jgi:hypothetical protein
MRLLKAAALAILLAALGWSAYWFVAAEGREAALEGWLEARRAEGWLAEARTVEVAGFPTRFERRLEAPTLADPQAGWSWRAPSLSIASAAWDPTHVTVTFPERQSVAVPGRRFEVASERLEALAAVVPSASLALRGLGLEAAGLAVEAEDGLSFGAGRVSLSLDRLPETKAPENAYDAAIDADAVRLPEALGRALGAGGATTGGLVARGQVVTDRRLDRDVIEEGEVGLRTLVVREGRLDYAGVSFDVSGRLDADAEGYAEGSLDVVARDWRRFLDGLEASGAVGEAAATALRQGLRLVTMFSGDDALDITLNFSDGRMRVGPVGIGPAPRLREPGAAG